VSEEHSPPRYELSAHAALTLNARGIELAWVQECLEGPERTELDRMDPALRHALRRIEGFGGRVLRVVYNPGAIPVLVVTAFFDRSVKGPL
jgi:hypothetical protein